ncbi:MAG: hypothetical protein IKL84_01535, partial [Clostridia bacterium]|nr:hypothetical protein [Clostridia bacterium]
IVATVDIEEGLILSGPDLISRGFVYVRESEELMEQARKLVFDALTDCLDSGVVDRMEIKSKVKDDLSKFLYAKTKRKPMVLPVIMNV